MSTEKLNSAERIKILRERLESIGQTEFAKKLGIPRHKIADIEFGKVKISVELALMLEEKFNVNFRWALTGIGDPFQKDTDALIHPERCLSPEDFVTLPMLESRVMASPEGEIFYAEIRDYYPFKRWWIEKNFGRSEERLSNLLIVKVRGDSMSPTIDPGEIVLVDTYEPERIHILTGKIYVITMPDGSSAIKRLALSKDANRFKLICISDNLAVYRPFEFELDPEKSIKHYVLGRVRWAGKEFD
ncbi:MAG: S24 family peptidase [Syntrophobacteraceae bacterium]